MVAVAAPCYSATLYAEFLKIFKEILDVFAMSLFFYVKIIMAQSFLIQVLNPD